MDTIAQHLSQLSHSVRVPRSVPGLVSRRLMVMSFMEGLPLLQLKDKVAHMPQWKREKVRGHWAARKCGAVLLLWSCMLDEYSSCVQWVKNQLCGRDECGSHVKRMSAAAVCKGW